MIIAYQAQADHEEWNINKFEISPSDHNSIVWDKIIRTLKKIGINAELKS